MNHEDCYKEMYLALTNEITNTIERLQAIQQKAEECYIYAGESTTYRFPKDAETCTTKDLANVE